MNGNGLVAFFEENYTQWKHYLKRRFYELNEYDAEDIISQTIMKLLYKGDDLFSIGNLSAYVYTSLQNGAMDHFRRGKNVILQAEQPEVETTTIEGEILLTELNFHIQQAIEALDEKSRYVFVETEIKGRSYEALVAETGEPLGTLLSRKNRAKKKLQNNLNQYLGRSNHENKW